MTLFRTNIRCSINILVKYFKLNRYFYAFSWNNIIRSNISNNIASNIHTRFILLKNKKIEKYLNYKIAEVHNLRSIFLNSILESHMYNLYYKNFFLSFFPKNPLLFFYHQFFTSNFLSGRHYSVIDSSVVRVTAQPCNKLSSTSTYDGIAKRKHWITATSDFLWRNELTGIYTDLVVRMSTNIESFLFKSRGPGRILCVEKWRNEWIHYCWGVRLWSCISIISNYCTILLLRFSMGIINYYNKVYLTLLKNKEKFYNVINKI